MFSKALFNECSLSCILTTVSRHQKVLMTFPWIHYASMSYLFTINLFPQQCACTEMGAWRKRLSFWATHSCNSPVATSWECRGGGSSWWGCECRGYWRTAESREGWGGEIVHDSLSTIGVRSWRALLRASSTNTHTCIHLFSSQSALSHSVCLSCFPQEDLNV